MLTTIVYYTSNRENESFERKIIERLPQDMPIISVSQKPMNLGKNICVGDIGVSPENGFKQMLIGCEAATTPFVTFAEADTIYPPDYFNYQPDDINKRYWFESVYVLYRQGGFYLKGRSDCAHMSGREYAIKLLKEGNGKGMEYRGDYRPIKVQLEYPIVNIKTGNGMRPKTQTSKESIDCLPYWGRAELLREDLFGN